MTTAGGDDDDDRSTSTSSDWRSISSSKSSNNSTLRARQEEQLAQDFGSTLWKHVQSLRRRRQDSAVDFLSFNEEESRLLRSLPIGWWQGALAGAVTLGTLRMGPMHLARFLQRQQKSKPSSSKSITASPFTKKEQQPIIVSDLQQNETGFLYAFWWTLDIGVSLFAATTVTVVCTDYHGVYQDLARIPLLPGTSPLCHHVCPVAMQTMQKYQDDPVTAPLLLHKPVTPTFQSCQEMVRNCQRRSAYASLNGMPNADEIINVPSPQGVPMDIQYLPLKQDEHGDDVYDLQVWNNTPRQEEETSFDE